MQRIFVLLVLLILISNRFYDPFFIRDGNDQLFKFLYYLTFAILTFFVCVEYMSKKKMDISIGSIRIDKAVGLLLMGLLFSIINALLFKGQDFFTGLQTSAGTLIAYLVYFDLRFVSFSVKDLEKLALLFGWIYIISVILGYATLPNPIFGTFEFDEAHRGLRFEMTGIHWMTLMFFCYLGKYKKSRKIKYLSFALIAYVIVLSSLTRQYIVLSTVLGGLYVLKMFSLWRRILLISIIVFFSFGVLPQLQFVNNLIEITDDQVYSNETGKEDVRVKDYRVFLIDYERNILQYMFGCGLGAYNSSKYGRELERMAESEWLNTVDAGWAGFVFYFGYFAAIVLIYIILHCLFKRIPPDYVYLKYFVTFLALCAIASGPIIFPNEYIILMIVFTAFSSFQKKGSRKMQYLKIKPLKVV